MVAQLPVELRVEVLGADLRERAAQPRMRTDAGEGAPLELVRCLDHARRESRAERSRAGPAQLDGQAEPVVREPPGVVALGRLGDRVQHLLHAQIRELAVARAVELEPHAVDGVRLGGLEPRLEARGIVRRVAALRERDDADVEPELERELHPAQGRVLPGLVAVEAEVDAARQLPELAQLALGERRPHRRDDGLDPGLAERDHVRVPLDDDGAVLLRDRRPGEVEAVEDVRLAEELALGRVDVLAAQRVVLVHLPGLEADHPAARVGEREHEAALEVVQAAPRHEPGGRQLVAACSPCPAPS